MTQKLFVCILLVFSLSAYGSEQGRAQSVNKQDSVIHLPAVEVNEKHFSFIRGGSIRKMQVDADLTTFPSTASEALRQIPSLVTDMEGNMFFRGSTKSSVLINNVPYGVMEENSGDVLIQLPALFFNQISWYSMPGIEAIPDGSSGLLALSSQGIFSTSPFQINLGAGLQERYNAGALLQVRPGKFHIAAKYNYRREFRERTFKKTTTNDAGTTLMDNKASGRPDVHIADLSVAYDLSSRDVLAVYGMYHLMNYSRYGGIHNTKLNPAGDVMNKMLRHRYNGQRQEAYAAEARWNHLFASPDEKLSVTFNYNHFMYDEDNHFENENPKGEIVKQDNSFINQEKHQYYLSVRYNKVFGSGWFFKTGYGEQMKSDKYASITEDLKNGNWVPDKNKRNEFSFNRSINRLYASLRKNFSRFGAEIGLQGEYTWQETKNPTQKDRAKDTYFHLYPHINLSYHDLTGGRWLLSYAQRVDRPLSNDLNPFRDSTDLTYIKEGNPYLQPEFVHLTELSYTFANEYFRIIPATYYRYRTNRIMDMAVSGGEGVIWRKENIGNTHTAGFELSTYWFPFRFLSVGVSGNVFWDQIDGHAIGYDSKKSMSCWDIKGNVKFSITANTELQIDGFYISDQLTAQGKIKSHYTLNAGVSQYLLDRKLRINFSIHNILDSLKEITVVNSRAFQLHQERNRDSRVSWISLTYLL